MIRTSRHIIPSNTNRGKLAFLDSLFADYKHDLEIYIDYIINDKLPIKTNLSSALLPAENIKHSRYKQIIYKQASEIIRSQLDKASKKRYSNYKRIYRYYATNKADCKFTLTKFSDLKLKKITKSKYFTKPSLNSISINLDERFFNIQAGKYFNNFINIKLPYFNDKGTRAIQINVPINHHKHSNTFKLNGFKLRNNIQIKLIDKNYYISLIWEKNVSIKTNGNVIGIDMGYKKLIVTSDNQFLNGDLANIYTKIANKKQGSNGFKRSLKQRDNEVNRVCNQLNLCNLKGIIIEDLNSVKVRKKYSGSAKQEMPRWSYRQTIDKLTRMCEVNSIRLEKVSAAYTSQTCSVCGAVDKNSRLGEKYRCTACKCELDADYNASINIYNRGIYSFST